MDAGVESAGVGMSGGWVDVDVAECVVPGVDSADECGEVGCCDVTVSGVGAGGVSAGVDSYCLVGF